MGDVFLEIPAVHEAGRAVLRHLIDQKIGYITIDRPPHRSGEATGDSPAGPGSLWAAEQIRQTREEAMICCAGDIAAYIHLARQLRQHRLAGQPTIDRAVGIAVAQFAVHAQQLAQHIDSFLEDTRTELDAHWPKVERLAAVLLKRRSLTPDEAAWILSERYA